MIEGLITKDDLRNQTTKYEAEIGELKETPRNRGTKRGIRITAYTSPKTVRRVHFIKLTAFSYQPDKDSPMRISYKI